MQVAVDPSKQCGGTMRGLMREWIALMLAVDAGDTECVKRLA
jgi:hypothetical protein